MKFGVRKLESWGWLPDGEETITLAFLFWHNTSAWQTDRQTERHVAITITRA